MKKLLTFVFVFAVGTMLMFGCSNVAKVEDGDTVKLKYIGTFEDGTVFDSSEGHDPIEFTLGTRMVIPGLETGVLGMIAFETKTITIPPEQAYGPLRPDMIVTAPKDKLPPDMVYEVGQQLESRQSDGRLIFATVTKVTEDSVRLDTNHPLAGKTLIFDIELLEITKSFE